MKTALEALKRLRNGNRRFVAGRQKVGDVDAPARRDELVSGQAPHTIFLGCSDSRVPAEIVFDQSLGDLFVIRVAGNIVARSQIGSVEFAAEQFGTKLVVVMGHTSCGAVQATIDELTRPTGTRSPYLRAIVEHIRPAVETLLESNGHLDRAKLVELAVRANVRASVNMLRHGSEILGDLVDNTKLLIVGAEYSLETGEVDFFDNMPSEALLSSE